MLEDALGVIVIVAHHGAGDNRLLPDILAINFGDGDIELAVEASNQRLEPAALFLK